MCILDVDGWVYVLENSKFQMFKIQCQGVCVCGRRVCVFEMFKILTWLGVFLYVCIVDVDDGFAS